MPKVINYPKGSLIFVEGDKDDRIFILQSGTVVLVNNDLETGHVTNENLAIGEFFGVKSSLAHVPRQETATVISDAVVVQLTQAEFEKIFSPNQAVMLKMLRVFSRNLRDLHYKIEHLLDTDYMPIPSDLGMLMVAKAFFEEEMYSSCSQVCNRVLERYPYEKNQEVAKKLLDNVKRHQGRVKEPVSTIKDGAVFKHKTDSPLKQFDLPMFDRFSKKYVEGDVIICEYEPGESFYLVQSGQVQLEKLISGSIKLLDIFNPGEFFGEMAILDDSPRTATCVAKGDVRCLEFNKENFKILVTGNPQIAMILLRLFCKRIYDQKRRIKILLIQDLQTRIADIFVLYEELGYGEQDKPDSNKRKFTLKVNDIAHWAGISNDDARDAVDKMAARGKIEVFDSYIIAKNINDMKRMVDSYYAVQNAKRKTQ